MNTVKHLFNKLARFPADHEVFNYIGCAFDVTEAKKMVKDREPSTSNMEAWKSMIFPEKTKNEGKTLVMCPIAIDEEKAKHVNTDEPIIVAVVQTAEKEKSYVIIDGNHRVFKRLWLEKKKDKVMKVHVLTPAETFSIMLGPVRSLVQEYLLKKEEKEKNRTRHYYFWKGNSTPDSISWSYRDDLEDVNYNISKPFKTFTAAKTEAKKYIREMKLSAEERSSALWHLNEQKLQDCRNAFEDFGNDCADESVG